MVAAKEPGKGWHDAPGDRGVEPWHGRWQRCASRGWRLCAGVEAQTVAGGGTRGAGSRARGGDRSQVIGAEAQSGGGRRGAVKGSWSAVVMSSMMSLDVQLGPRCRVLQIRPMV